MSSAPSHITTCPTMPRFALLITNKRAANLDQAICRNPWKDARAADRIGQAERSAWERFGQLPNPPLLHQGGALHAPQRGALTRVGREEGIGSPAGTTSSRTRPHGSCPLSSRPGGIDEPDELLAAENQDAWSSGLVPVFSWAGRGSWFCDDRLSAGIRDPGSVEPPGQRPGASSVAPDRHPAEPGSERQRRRHHTPGPRQPGSPGRYRLRHLTWLRDSPPTQAKTGSTPSATRTRPKCTRNEKGKKEGRKGITSGGNPPATGRPPTNVTAPLAHPGLPAYRRPRTSHDGTRPTIKHALRASLRDRASPPLDSGPEPAVNGAKGRRQTGTTHPHARHPSLTQTRPPAPTRNSAAGPRPGPQALASAFGGALFFDGRDGTPAQQRAGGHRTHGVRTQGHPDRVGPVTRAANAPGPGRSLDTGPAK